MARAMLGQWEEAAKYLRLASKLDHDEEIDYVLKMVLLYFFYCMDSNSMLLLMLP